MVSVPRIKNSGARGEVMLFSGVGVESFSRVGGGVRGGRNEWARMKVGEEGAGDGIGAVVETLSGFEDALSRRGGDGRGPGRVVHDERDGGGREAEILGEGLQVYGFWNGRLGD